MRHDQDEQYIAAGRSKGDRFSLTETVMPTLTERRGYKAELLPLPKKSILAFAANPQGSPHGLLLERPTSRQEQTMYQLGKKPDRQAICWKNQHIFCLAPGG